MDGNYGAGLDLLARKMEAMTTKTSKVPRLLDFCYSPFSVKDTFLLNAIAFRFSPHYIWNLHCTMDLCFYALLHMSIFDGHTDFTRGNIKSQLGIQRQCKDSKVRQLYKNRYAKACMFLL